MSIYHSICVLSTASDALCGLCANRCVTNWCDDCRQWMCKTCLKTHSKIPSCKRHTVLPLAVKRNELNTIVTQEARSIRAKCADFSAHLSQLQATVARLEARKLASLATSRSLRQHTLADVNKHFDSLDEQILAHFADNMSKFQTESDRISKHSAALSQQLSNLETMLKNNQNRLAVEGDQILNRIRALLSDKSYDNLPGVDTAEVSVSVIKGSTWDASSAGSVQLKSGPHASVELAATTRDVNVATSLRADYELRRQISLENDPWSVRLIGDKLWTCQSDGVIQIFDLDLSLVSSLSNKTYGFINDVIDLSNDTVVLASNNGLFTMTSEGIELETVASDNFKSLAFDKNKLYAYDQTNLAIQVYSYCGMLKHEETIKTPFRIGLFVTLCVKGDVITACCNDECVIYKMTSAGSVLATHGSQGCDQPGEMSFPYLCEQDDVMTLVADECNDRLQVLDDAGQWKVVSLQPPVEAPRRALVLDDKLYVVSCAGNSLSLYHQ